MPTPKPRLCACGETDPAAFYGHRKSECTRCQKARNARYAAEHADEVAAYKREHARLNPEIGRRAKRRQIERNPDYERERYQRRRANPAWAERRRQQQSRSREENRDDERERVRRARSTATYTAWLREWKRAHREQLRAAARARRAADPERHRRWSRENARRRRLGYDEIAVAYAEILASDPCVYCGEPAGEVDHLDPIAKGGANDWSNLTAACRTCNARKGHRSVLEALLLAH